jgi:radical SAM protein with 4Fe4S-binding SPASM domain
MEHQSYHSVWQRLHASAKNKGFPLRVIWELTYRCNFKCRHCYLPQSYRKKGELKTKEIFSILDQLKDIGCFYLGFTGGEPFMRKDILDILWYAKRCGLQIIIYTNGSLIDENIAKEIARLQPNKVDITIPAMTKDTFERITKMAGSHEKVFKAIEFLKKGAVNLGFKTCLLKGNENQIKDIRDFSSSLGALHRLDDMLSPRLNGSKEPFRYRGEWEQSSVNKRRLPFAVKKEDESCYSRGVSSQGNGWSLFKCGAGLSQAAITPLGELKMCLMIDYPKYRILDTAFENQKFNLRNAWEKLKRLAVSIRPDEKYQCNECSLETYCKWCPAKAWLYKKNFTSCDPESRKKAELTWRAKHA